jgi:molecular chaperone GrpE
MGSNGKSQAANRIPIHFPGDEPEEDSMENSQTEEIGVDFADDGSPQDELSQSAEASAKIAEGEAGGPVVAELVASRAELKRLQNALSEAQDSLVRRQADFENYRKRVERERTETYNRVVGEVARKLLPVMDNLTRALDAEKSIETNESAEFRHFLHGVELIGKQLSEVLESFGIEPIAAVGERFDPHVHEAVATEPSDKYEPDTVIEELARGYRMGDRLLRPAMVKVAAHKIET